MKKFLISICAGLTLLSSAAWGDPVPSYTANIKLVNFVSSPVKAHTDISNVTVTVVLNNSNGNQNTITSTSNAYLTGGNISSQYNSGMAAMFPITFSTDATSIFFSVVTFTATYVDQLGGKSSIDLRCPIIPAQNGTYAAPGEFPNGSINPQINFKGTTNVDDPNAIKSITCEWLRQQMH